MDIHFNALFGRMLCQNPILKAIFVFDQYCAHPHIYFVFNLTHPPYAVKGNRIFF